MKFAIIEVGVVANLAVAETPLQSNWVEATDAVSIGDLWDGENFTHAPTIQKSSEQIQTEIVTETQKRLDDFAKTRNYDSILSACTYASDTNLKFSAEGQYCIDSRGATWTKLYQILAEVEAATRQMPTGYADIESELPTLAWPN